MAERVLSSVKVASLRDLVIYVIVLGAGWLAFSFVSSAAVQIIASIVVIWFGWTLLYESATFLTANLQGARKTVFQVVVAIGAPAAFSIYFVHRTIFPPDFESAYILWLVIPSVLIAVVSWAASANMSHDFPVRAFLMASGILFLSGIYEVHRALPEDVISGRYFMQYLIYVAAAYAAICGRIYRGA